MFVLGWSGCIVGIRRTYARRGLLVHLIGRQLRSQFKQSLLGYAWLFFQPLALMCVFTFVFSHVLRMSVPGIPYPLFFLTGLVPWTFFNVATTSATESLVVSPALIKNVYFPREMIPFASIAAKLVDLWVGIGLVFLFIVIYGRPIYLTTLWIFVLIPVQLLVIIGLALPCAAINVFFRDVKFTIGILLSLLFYMTPVMYPPEMVPEQFRIILTLNPNAALITAYHDVLLRGVSPDMSELATATAISVAVFVLGYKIFNRLERSLTDFL